MLKKYLVAAAVTIAGLAAATAVYAATAAESTLDAKVKASPTNAGTSSNPKSEKLSLNLDGGLKPGVAGQPETTDKIIITTPFKYRGSRWPAKSRCDNAAADQAKSNKDCPSPSRVGKGQANLQAANGAIRRTLELTVHVIKNGKLGIWAQTRPGESPAVAQFIPSSISGSKISFDIPPNLEQPLGVKSSIDLLTASIGGTVSVKGKSYGILESTSCPKGGWKFGVTFDTFTGDLKDTATQRCRP